MGDRKRDDWPRCCGHFWRLLALSSMIVAKPGAGAGLEGRHRGRGRCGMQPAFGPLKQQQIDLYNSSRLVITWIITLFVG